MANERVDLPQGTLDLLILKTLAVEKRHGWSISERLHQISSATLQVRQGSIYPALHRLEARGWLEAEWGTSENNRRAKFYTLSAAGRRQLKSETAAWTRFARAVFAALDAPATPA